MADVTVCAVGDVVVNRDDPKSMFEKCAEHLQSGDLVWGNCETAYTTRGIPNVFMGPIADKFLRTDPKNIEGLTWAGFNVMGMANNRNMELGHEGFLDTLENLAAAGIETTGGGRNIYEARTPMIKEVNGTQIGFLAYAPVCWVGFEATEERIGVASLKVHTYYERPLIDHPHHGKPPYVHTFVDPSHLEAFKADVVKAKSQCDVLLIGFHWGIHFESGQEGFSPLLVAEYEFELSRAAIDSGADVILGGGQHIMKAIEVYKGKVVFHGLGNFAFDLPASHEAHSKAKAYYSNGPYGSPFGRGGGMAGFAAALMHDPQGAIGEARSPFLPVPDDRPEYPTYPFHPLCRRNMIVKVRVDDKKISRVSLVPCEINKQGQPVAYSPDDEYFETLQAWVSEVTEGVNIDTKFEVEDGEITVVTS